MFESKFGFQVSLRLCPTTHYWSQYSIFTQSLSILPFPNCMWLQSNGKHSLCLFYNGILYPKRC